MKDVLAPHPDHLEAIRRVPPPWDNFRHGPLIMLAHRLAGHSYFEIARYYGYSEALVRMTMSRMASAMQCRPDYLLILAARDCLPALPLPVVTHVTQGA